MRGSTILDIPLQEQEWMLAELRQARPGCVLALHVLLLCAAGRTPTEIATFLFCSRTSVYRIVQAYHTQLRDARFAQPLSPVGGLTPSVRRRLRALLTKVPVVYGWCRTLGMEAGPVDRPRRRPAAGREARPYPPHAGNPGKTGRGAVCR